jgi:hypothetical protein
MTAEGYEAKCTMRGFPAEEELSVEGALDGERERLSFTGKFV